LGLMVSKALATPEQTETVREGRSVAISLNCAMLP